MHYYIDESGIFNNPANKSNIASCVACLVIPSSKKKDVFKDFKRLTWSWVAQGEEIKGSKLNETQISKVIEMLQRYDVLLELTVIDLAIHTEQDIIGYKDLSVEGLTKNLTPKHHPNIVQQVQEIKSVFAEMSIPLFIQATIMFFLIPRTFHHSLLYYARRIPEELKWFYWTVDAKEKNITAFEKAWSTAIFPVMSAQSLKKPIFFAEGGDYSYFEKFHNLDKKYLEEIENEGGFEPNEVKAIKLSEVLGKNFRFQDSKTSLGLQIVDILANATQRALNGKLGKIGWENIGSLMIRRVPNPIQLVALKPDKKPGQDSVIIRSPFYGVFETYKTKAKTLWRDNE
ncbi:MAG TPA: DUF3800 domain-containing protein [Pyrinomonadaceae bacterium]|jgi:hypothetical protein